jgi:hypothetical protein
LETSNITFSTLPLPWNRPFIPTVKELFREGISGHTCDRRGNKTYIQDNFPTYVIEKGFSEQDLLWKVSFFPYKMLLFVVRALELRAVPGARKP